MKETLASFLSRTGRSYTPPLAARPLAPDEPCPTLHRWPGPHALRDALLGGIDRLGPKGSGEVMLAADPRRTSDSGRAAAEFGAIAVLEPLRFSPAEVAPGVYVAANLRIDDPERIVWIPPAVVLSGISDSLDGAAAAREAIPLLGAGYGEARARALDAVQGYLEELAELSRAGVPGPPVPWCDLSVEERARTLAAAGIRSRWTIAV